MMKQLSYFFFSILFFLLAFIGAANSQDANSLHDIWMLEEINNEAISIEGNKRPRLEIFVSDMKYQGNGGCNNFSGKIESIEKGKISFGLSISTRIYCEESMDLETKFLSSLDQVASWKRKGQRLHLFDASGAEILEFGRTD